MNARVKRGGPLTHQNSNGGGFVMKKLLFATLACFAIALIVAPVEAAQSLRGDLALEDQQKAPDFFKQKTDEPEIKRNFKTQPPLVPHRTAKYKVNLKSNKCLSCHDKDTYKEEEAPLAGKSHYIGADGKEMKTINMGRYFCSQCHVPQANAKPLVENTFKGAN